MLNLAPLLPFWEKGLGDEGDSCKRSNEWHDNRENALAIIVLN
jgi:hypothetical protein